MAYRNTIEEVKSIISTDVPDNDFDSFLSTANTLVNDVLANEGYSDVLLKQIECWLTAHFIAIRDPRASREKIGDVDVQYHGKSGMGLTSTPYGQQVLILEHHGRFAQITGGKGPAEIKAIA